jgi:SWIM zinc finger
MAPDASAVKAGRELGRPAKWVSAGADDKSIWGECQGSGSKPYQTQVDLSEPAFKCSCPSRKFPCKHSLGLMLLYATSRISLTQTVPPEWVQAWMSSRASKSEQKAKRIEESENDTEVASKPKSTGENSAKSVAARESKIASGLDNLELWLRDKMRTGIAEIGSGSHRQFDDQAARLVDSQAPGLAQMVRDLSGIASTGQGWQDRLLEKLGLITLLIESYRKQELLPADLRADVRGLIGWTQSQDAVLASSGISDEWTVLGSNTVPFGKLTEQRSWLWGENTKRYAVIIQYIVRGAKAAVSLPQGSVFDGEVVYFASATPMRALIKSREPSDITLPPDFGSMSESMAECGQRLAAQPWLTYHPYGIKDARPALDSDGNWRILDHHTSEWLAVSSTIDDLSVWRLMALCGDNPCPIFGEWDSHSFMPISIWSEKGFISI